MQPFGPRSCILSCKCLFRAIYEQYVHVKERVTTTYTKKHLLCTNLFSNGSFPTPVFFPCGIAMLVLRIQVSETDIRKPLIYGSSSVLTFLVTTWVYDERYHVEKSRCKESTIENKLCFWFYVSIAVTDPLQSCVKNTLLMTCIYDMLD